MPQSSAPELSLGSKSLTRIKTEQAGQHLRPACSIIAVFRLLYHEGSYETEDSVELRKSGVDKGVCEDIVAL